jgi:glycerol-3-phosphate acyltransferase PlsY
VLRQVGKGPALVVFLIDVGKGAAAVLLARAFGQSDWIQVLAGLTALAGHIWPVWLNFKGGKAVATGFGMFLGLAWPVGLASFGVFLLTLWLFRIVSLSSVLAAVSLPLLMIRFSGIGSYILIALVAMGLVLWRHRSNLSRILEGSEPKVGQQD